MAMRLDLETSGITATKELRGDVESCARNMLGRLSRRVRRVALALRQLNRSTGASAHACTLRLRARGLESDILVESVQPDVHAAVAGAFRRARHELIRRRGALRRNRAVHTLPAAA